MHTKLIQINNPVGEKIINIDEEDKSIVVEIIDFAPGSRSFFLTINLTGRGVSCEVVGCAKSFGNDKKSWFIQQYFFGENQSGILNLRGTAGDKSFLHFEGKGVLTQGSREVSVDIKEKIMLFDEGQGKLLPVLRVETDRVKSATHGASIAPIGMESLLYLQSRGVNPLGAKKIISDGFLQIEKAGK